MATITIEVCDNCKQQKELLKYSIPAPSIIWAYGGRGTRSKIIYDNEYITTKHIVLCEKCAKKMSRFLVEMDMARQNYKGDVEWRK